MDFLKKIFDKFMIKLNISDSSTGKMKNKNKGQSNSINNTINGSGNITNINNSTNSDLKDE